MVLRIVAFAALWTVYFIVTEYASAIHNDMAEAYAWGREFQGGYNQHPPFWAWVCGVWFLVFARANWAFAALAMLNAGLGLAGAWALAGRFVEGERRAGAVAALALTPFYTFLAYKYNANSIFLSLWPWTLYAFLGALSTRGLATSLGFGLMMGLALNSKYYAFVLAATCLMAALASPERARYFRSFSPYLSVFVALALWAPHLAWLAASGAPPIQYLTHVSGRSFGETGFFALTAVAGALAAQGVAWGVIALAARGRRGAAGGDVKMVALLTLAPLGLSVLAAFALRTKLSSNMLIGVFPLSPLLAILWLRPDPERVRAWTMRGAAGVTLGALALSPAIAVGKAWLGRDSEDAEPRREAALAATEFWAKATSAPLDLVAGSFRYDNAVVFYSREHPSAFVDFSPFGNRWVTPERIATRGLLTICRREDAGCLAQTERWAGAEAKRAQVRLAHAPYGRARGAVEFVFTAIPPTRRP